jgi:hypothetical protein
LPGKEWRARKRSQQVKPIAGSLTKNTKTGIIPHYGKKRTGER